MLTPSEPVKTFAPALAYAVVGALFAAAGALLKVSQIAIAGAAL